MGFVTMSSFIFIIVLVCAIIIALVSLIMNIVQWKYIKELEVELDKEHIRAERYKKDCVREEVRKILNDFQEY